MRELSKDAKRFNRITQFLGRLAQRPHHGVTTWLLTTLLAKLTLLSKKGSKQGTPEAITEEWLRMFPRGICSLDRIEDGTGYGLVHADCSLVGTGNVQACYKMMNYDRELIKKLGGTLTVVESRADPAVTKHCRVAIRPIGDKRTDLIPAHLL